MPSIEAPSNGNENRKQFSIYIDEQDYSALVRLAKEDDRSLVSYVRNVLKKHINKKVEIN